MDNELEYGVLIEDPSECCFVNLKDVKLKVTVEITKVVYECGYYKVFTVVSRDGVPHAGYCELKTNEAKAYLEEDYSENFEPVNLRLDLLSYERIQQLPLDDVERIVRFCFQ